MDIEIGDHVDGKWINGNVVFIGGNGQIIVQQVESGELKIVIYPEVIIDKDWNYEQNLEIITSWPEWEGDVAGRVVGVNKSEKSI